MGSSNSRLIEQERESSIKTEQESQRREHKKRALEDQVHESIQDELINLECKQPIIPTEEDPATLIVSGIPSEYSQEEILDMMNAPTKDRRIKVENTQYWPFSVHGRLISTCEGDSYLGSGTIIGSQLVLTAAHNVYIRKHAQAIDKDSIKFMPAMNGFACPYGKLEIAEIYYPKEYEYSGKEDYALLVLKEPIANHTGCFGLKPMNKEDLKGKAAYLYGYPTDMPGQDLYLHYMWGMEGSFEIDSADDMLEYQLDTSPGQSGSGLFCEQDGKYYVIGIHIQDANTNAPSNHGIYLKESRIERIKGWIRDYYIKCNIVTNLKLSYIQDFVYKLQDEVTKSHVDFNELHIGVDPLYDNNSRMSDHESFCNLSDFSCIYNGIEAKGAFHGKITKLSSLHLDWKRIGEQELKGLSQGNLVKLANFAFTKIRIGLAPRGVALASLAKLTTLYLQSNHPEEDTKETLSNLLRKISG